MDIASSSSCSSCCSTTAGGALNPAPSATPGTPSSSNPTTFIQADSSSFKQVVQMLTGAAVTTAKTPLPPQARTTGTRKPAFKLYERRSCMKNLKMISTVIPAVAVKSNLSSPADSFSPVTPLIADPFSRSSDPRSAEAAMAEERAIAKKGFYLHPSPRTVAAAGNPPRLLPLFPVTSPRVSPFSSP